MVQAHHRFTFGDYVDIEQDSLIKHEFLDGQVWAMSGGTPAHSAIAVNVATLLNQALRGRPCRVFNSDLRIRVKATGLGTYPDVSVICGRIDLDPDDPKGHTALNPRILIEVLSPSTEPYDRGDKLWHYQHIPSLEEVVLVAHDRHEVEIVRKEADGTWSRRVLHEGETAHIVALECDLPVAEVYRDPLGGIGGP